MAFAEIPRSTYYNLVKKMNQPDREAELKAEIQAIYIGRKNITDYSLESWRRHIGYVSQESPLLAGTIRENICYGIEREVTDEELRQGGRTRLKAFRRSTPENRYRPRPSAQP